MHIYVRVESNGVLQNSQQRATTTQLDTFKAFSCSLKSNLIDIFFYRTMLSLRKSKLVFDGFFLWP